MTDKKEKFDNNFNPHIPDGLKKDLNALFKSRISIPAEVDRAVLDRASVFLLQRHQRRNRIFRWAGSVAAAAAIIIFVCIFINHTAIEGDIDRNGRVNILDAFVLARQIESADSPNKNWDMNGDGLVNQSDVDTIALVAVNINKGDL
jgi:hypothetical protein